MLIGTSKRLSHKVTDFTVNYRGAQINNVDCYKYLGVIINSTLNFNQHYKKTLKKAGLRIRLVERIWPNVSSNAAWLIYQLIIVPVFTYLTSDQISKLHSLTNRAGRIGGDNGVNIQSIHNKVLKRSCVFVRKALNGEVCSNLRKLQ